MNLKDKIAASCKENCCKKCFILVRIIAKKICSNFIFCNRESGSVFHAFPTNCYKFNLSEDINNIVAFFI